MSIVKVEVVAALQLQINNKTKYLSILSEIKNIFERRGQKISLLIFNINTIKFSHTQFL